MGPRRIVFICSGNICRSPMAAALGERALQQAGIDAEVISAGTLGIEGSPAAPHSVDVMRELGIDISGHRSRGLSPEMARIADYLVIMSPRHRFEVLERDPSLEAKIQALWQFDTVPGRLDEIEDPLGGDRSAVLECRRNIEACMDGWVRHVRALGHRKG